MDLFDQWICLLFAFISAFTFAASRRANNLTCFSSASLNSISFSFLMKSASIICQKSKALSQAVSEALSQAISSPATYRNRKPRNLFDFLGFVSFQVFLNFLNFVKFVIVFHHRKVHHRRIRIHPLTNHPTHPTFQPKKRTTTLTHLSFLTWQHVKLTFFS